MSKISMRLPKTLQDGDEITIGGNMESGATGFCLNFTENIEDEEQEPDDVMYRFQFEVIDNKIKQDWKACGEWQNEVELTDKFLLDDSKLILTFKFINNEVLVYSGDEGRNYECSYPLEHSMTRIGQVCVCGDLEKLNHVTFRYA